MRSKEEMLKVLAAGRAKRMANLKGKKAVKKVVKKKCKCTKNKYDTNDSGI